MSLFVQHSEEADSEEKDSSQVYEYIMNSQQHAKKVTKTDLFLTFFKNPTNNTTLYSGHFQELKRSRSQDQLWLATFIMKNTCSKTFYILISQKQFF